MTPTLIFALTLLVFSSILIQSVSKNLKIMALHIFLLLISPWFLNLLLGKPTIMEYSLTKPQNTSFFEILAQLSSTDLVFFKSLPKVKYAVGNYGFFLPSFLPIITMGLWTVLNDKKVKKIIIVFLISFLASSILTYFVGYLSLSIFLIDLSIFATIGFYKFAIYLQTNKSSIYLKLLITANFGLIFYEMLRLAHSINVQMKLN